jgi:hypothetical protein
MNFLIEPQAAIQLRKGIRDLLDNEELKSFALTFGNEKTRSSLTIFKPETLKLQKQTFPNYILKLTKMKDDQEQKMFHLLQKSSAVFKNTDNEELDDEMEVDLELLIEFCNQVVASAFCVAYHGARRNGQASTGSGYGGGNSKPARRQVQEDGDDEGDDAAPARAAGKPAGKPTAPARRSSLKDEFNEE